MAVTVAKARQFAREIPWRIRRESVDSSTLTHPLPPDAADTYSVRWPEHLEWKSGEKWIYHIREGMQRLLPLERVPIPQPYAGISVFHLVRDGVEYPIVIDYSDYMNRIDDDARQMATVYLKMQYRVGGYGTREGFADIQPGGYVVPNDHAYSYFAPVRRRGTRRPVHDVYGRYSLEFATGVRKQAITLLRDQRRFEYYGGSDLVRYSQHLIDSATSKVCVDLPGNGPFCFRLMDYFAVGACIVAVRHETQLPVPLIPGVHIAYVKDDLSDLVDLCQFYVENDAAREAMQRASRMYFDLHLSRVQLAGYYLERCFAAIDALRASAPPDRR